MLTLSLTFSHVHIGSVLNFTGWKNDQLQVWVKLPVSSSPIISFPQTLVYITQIGSLVNPRIHRYD